MTDGKIGVIRTWHDVTIEIEVDTLLVNTTPQRTVIRFRLTPQEADMLKELLKDSTDYINEDRHE